MSESVSQEEQVRKVRAGNQERFQQLESAIQDKLQQAADRRLQIEAEQREKLRNHVSTDNSWRRCDVTWGQGGDLGQG